MTKGVTKGGPPRAAETANDRCVPFLQWALPRLGLRWRGYRNVRGQVCKRLARRRAELGLADLAAYRARLEADPAEWQVLAGLCSVTISRFYRDRRTWDVLCHQVMPELASAALAAGDVELRCWSLGCASGEEPYTLAIAWGLVLEPRYPGLRLRVLATDVNEAVLSRARSAEYAAGTLRDLPAGWRDQAFECHGGGYRLRERFRTAVELRRQDVRRAMPGEVFHLIFCRNMVFTYFDEALQRETLGRLLAHLASGGALVLGRHERPPPGAALERWHPGLEIFRQVRARPDANE